MLTMTLLLVAPPVTVAPAAYVAVLAGCTTNSFSIWLRSSSKSSRTSCCHPFSKSKKMYLPTSFCCAVAVASGCASLVLAASWPEIAP